MLPKDSNALRVLSESLGVKYDIFDALQTTMLGLEISNWEEAMFNPRRLKLVI